jgi:type IV pilus assembly protein PilW
MRPAPTARGVTLVELLVALGASAVVLALVVGSVVAQQQAFHGGQRVRETQSSARGALLYIEQKLAMAGFGMDPSLAFDLSGMPGDPDPAWYVGPCPPLAAPCTKDRTDGSDELHFFARNPRYWVPRPESGLPPTATRGRAWHIVSLDPVGGTVQLTAHAGDSFPKGLILQGVCPEGQGQRLFTVQTTILPLAADGDVLISLAPEGDLKNPFTRQSAGQCTPTRAFQIDRYRLHVRPIDVGDGTREGYLVLDRGIDVNLDGAVTEDDEAILATGVEVMQVAYHFTEHINAPPAPLAVVGATRGVPVTVVKGAPNEAIRLERGLARAADATAGVITRPDFTSPGTADAKYYSQASLFEFGFGPPIADERKTNYLANVRAVQIALVTRSISPAPEGEWNLLPVPPPWADATNYNFRHLNLDQVPAWTATASTTVVGADGLRRDQYARIRTETTVDLSNMVARRLFYD